MTQCKEVQALADDQGPDIRIADERAPMNDEGVNTARRDLLKLGATAGAGAAAATLGGGALLAPRSGNAQVVPPPAPVVVSPWNLAWAFVQPMPIPGVCQPTTTMKGPPPQNQPWSRDFVTANGLQAYVRNNPGHGGQNEEYYEARQEVHQRWAEFGNVDPVYENGNLVSQGVFNGKKYELECRETDWSFYPPAASGQVAPSKVWIYHDLNSSAAGILRINARYGEPALVRLHNSCPVDNRGFGIDNCTMHLHNAHNPPESDGGPLRWSISGEFFDYWYPNVRAGFASTHKNGTTYIGPDKVARQCPGDYKETQSTLWFHDHRMDFTAQNVYKGMASFYTLFSDDINLDTGKGDSSKLAERGLGLPSGEYDIPILLTDKRFDPSNGGQMYMDTQNFDGFLGDLVTCNFKIKPYLDVKRRRYRFRLLNAGPSRYYELSFYYRKPGATTNTPIGFVRIANDGNLLPKALGLGSVRLGVAERADIILDFAEVPQGTIIYMENRLDQVTPAGPAGVLRASSFDPRQRDATQILQIRVGGLPATADISSSKSKLLSMPSLLPLPVKPAPVRTRTFAFQALGAQWVINGQLFDPDLISAFPVEGTCEEWTWQSGGGWGHPVHIHHEEFQIVARDGVPVTASSEDYSRKDVARIGNGGMGVGNTGSVTWRMEFRDWFGDYVNHCHNVVHEDHAMMFRFMIVPPTDPNAGL